jgi:hypothetical protein
MVRVIAADAVDPVHRECIRTAGNRNERLGWRRKTEVHGAIDPGKTGTGNSLERRRCGAGAEAARFA